MGDEALRVGSVRVWQVGALCRAVADALEARFNPVVVTGELSGLTRASSGHVYFSLKDESGQLRCAMFRRAATLLGFSPREGDRVEVRGRLGVYEPRGELQLVVEAMRPAGQGVLLEQFLRLKEKLASEGLFDAARKKALPVFPRCIGVVTSLGAAALHDVVTALQRRVPHVAVIIAPAAVQGDSAPRELMQALAALYAMVLAVPAPERLAPDLILLVRGGGSAEDLWSFNDEQLARTVARSPVPVVCGVGHETDFTIADFVADVRAPTPTAAAEMAAQATTAWVALLDAAQTRMQRATTRHVDRLAQRLDLAVTRLGRPSALAQRQHLLLASLNQRLAHGARAALRSQQTDINRRSDVLTPAVQRALERMRDRLNRAALRLELLDPSLVLQRGYAWLTLADGTTLTHVAQARPGEMVRASLTDGTVELIVPT